jgi:phage protein U
LGGDSTAINLNAATFIVHGAVEKAAHSIQLSRSELDKNALIEELSEIISTYLFSEKEGTCDDDT